MNPGRAVAYLVGLVAVAAIVVAFFALSGRRAMPPSAPAAPPTIPAAPEPKVEAKSIAVQPSVRPGFAVQVGAFVHRERAEALASQLSERHQQSLRMSPAEVHNQTFYRVRFFVETKAEAVALAKSLRRDEKLPTWIVPVSSTP